MAGVNKVILLGNLGADPEVRHLESGGVVANISIATSESYNKNGQRMEQTEWHKVELWDRLAELAEKYLSKGNTVYIEGEIRTNTYQDKDGNTRYDKRIRATNMTFVGGRNEGNDTDTRDSQPSQQTQTNSPAQAQESPMQSGGDSDDLPF
jgi:single-strand DNA-binding protein